MVVVFDAELWEWDARRSDSWTFVSLPTEASEEIQDLAGGARRGFGSLRVRVTIGGTAWTTSIFPDATRGSYALAVKRAVRKAEALHAGDIATVTVELIDFDLGDQPESAYDPPHGSPGGFRRPSHLS